MFNYIIAAIKDKLDPAPFGLKRTGSWRHGYRGKVVRGKAVSGFILTPKEKK